MMLALVLFTGCSEESKIGEYINTQDLSEGNVEGTFTFDRNNLNEYNHYYIVSHFEGSGNRVQLYVRENLTSGETYLYVGMSDNHYLGKIIIEPYKEYDFDFSWSNNGDYGLYELKVNGKLYTGVYNSIEEKQSYIQIGGNGFTPDFQNKNSTKLERWSGELYISDFIYLRLNT